MTKEHKKLYKAGKNWVVATLTATTITLLGGIGAYTVHADTTIESSQGIQTTSVNQTNQVDNSNDSVTINQPVAVQSSQTAQNDLSVQGNQTNQTVPSSADVNSASQGVSQQSIQEAEAKKEQAENDIRRQQATVDNLQSVINDDQSEVDSAQKQSDIAKEPMDEAESNYNKALNHSDDNNSYPHFKLVKADDSTFETVNDDALMKMNDWSASTYADDDEKVQFDGNKQITGDSLRKINIFTANVINDLRRQIGTKPVSVNDISTNKVLEWSKAYQARRIESGESDNLAQSDPELNTYKGVFQDGTYMMTEDLYEEYMNGYTLAQLKTSVVSLIAQGLIDYKSTDNYSRRHAILGDDNNPNEFIGFNIYAYEPENEKVLFPQDQHKQVINYLAFMSFNYDSDRSSTYNLDDSGNSAYSDDEIIQLGNTLKQAKKNWEDTIAVLSKAQSKLSDDKQKLSDAMFKLDNAKSDLQAAINYLNYVDQLKHLTDSDSSNDNKDDQGPINSQPSNNNNNSASSSSNYGWVESYGIWHYMDHGNIRTGWQWLDNNWYYFDPNDGSMLIGIQRINDNIYYLNTKHDGTYGAMKTGWQFVNGHWIGLQGSGNAYVGWQAINGHWYYFDPQTAYALTNWQDINNHWYYFDPTNAWAQTGWFKSGAGYWYFFDYANAWADTGWQKINNSWYYFDNVNANALTGWQSINNHWYYFDPTNAWALTGWQWINGHWYWFDQANAWARTGWQYYGGQWYFMDQQNAWMDTGWTTNLANGQLYYLDKNGHPLTGWQRSLNGFWYYLQPGSDAAAIGWNWINGHWYYFNPEETINGIKAKGAMFTGRHFIDNRWNRFDLNGHWLGYEN